MNPPSSATLNVQTVLNEHPFSRRYMVARGQPPERT